MKKLNILVLTYLIISLSFSQDTNPASQSISVSIDQSMLNSFFNAIGEVKGKGSTKVIGKIFYYGKKLLMMIMKYGLQIEIIIKIFL